MVESLTENQGALLREENRQLRKRVAKTQQKASHFLKKLETLRDVTLLEREETLRGRSRLLYLEDRLEFQSVQLRNLWRISEDPVGDSANPPQELQGGHQDGDDVASDRNQTAEEVSRLRTACAAAWQAMEVANEQRQARMQRELEMGRETFTAWVEKATVGATPSSRTSTGGGTASATTFTSTTVPEAKGGKDEDGVPVDSRVSASYSVQMKKGRESTDKRPDSSVSVQREVITTQNHDAASKSSAIKQQPNSSVSASTTSATSSSTSTKKGRESDHKVEVGELLKKFETQTERRRASCTKVEKEQNCAHHDGRILTRTTRPSTVLRTTANLLRSTSTRNQEANGTDQGEGHATTDQTCSASATTAPSAASATELGDIQKRSRDAAISGGTSTVSPMGKKFVKSPLKANPFLVERRSPPKEIQQILFQGGADYLWSEHKKESSILGKTDLDLLYHCPPLSSSSSTTEDGGITTETSEGEFLGLSSSSTRTSEGAEAALGIGMSLIEPTALGDPRPPSVGKKKNSCGSIGSSNCQDQEQWI
ncbi:unnamed protein product [Amoebophrya sp. A25]|nr:unnamed protein product [Amoebophrya sp. A25]|eukprot:GSA25T00023049001.1